MVPEEYRVGYEGGAWVSTTTDAGVVPVHLEQGDALPENVSADELARLANGGVIEGFDQAPGLVGEPQGGEIVVLDGNADQVKVRVGDDVEVAQAYLDAEKGRAKPRVGLVEHLEGVIAASQPDPGPEVEES